MTCPTCGGTGWIIIPDPTASAWFPKKPLKYPCPDCSHEEIRP